MGHQGLLRVYGCRESVWECQAVSWCVGGVRGVFGGWRDSWYSGTRRGIEGIMGHWGTPRRCRKPFWGVRGCRGCQGCIGRLAGTLGTQGPEEVWGHQGH